MPSLPLYANAEGATLLTEYLCATPVKVLGDADHLDTHGPDGPLVQVQIANSDVIGYLQGYGLLTGTDQAWLTAEEGYEDWYYYTTAEAEDATWIILQPGSSLYSAPEGEILESVQHDTWLILMAQWPDGWAHVKYGESLESCFVRMVDCIPADE